MPKKNTNAGLLIINRSDSRCGTCSKGADPYETSHKTILSWTGKSEGCGAKYTAMTSYYVGLQMDEALKRMRPDLDLICYDDKLDRQVVKAPHIPYQLKLWDDGKPVPSLMDRLIELGAVTYDNS